MINISPERDAIAGDVGRLAHPPGYGCHSPEWAFQNTGKTAI